RCAGSWGDNFCPPKGVVPSPILHRAKITNLNEKPLRDGQKAEKNGGFPPASVLYMHRVLKAALAVAVSEWRLLPSNPAGSIKPPKLKRQSMRALDAAETAALLEAARPYRLFIPVLLAVTRGLRRGEIFAFRWRNVDLSGTMQLAIVSSIEQTKAGIREKETKSGRARTVALTALTIEELRRHKVRPAEELLRLGLRQSDDMYVVAQADGQPL